MKANQHGLNVEALPGGIGVSHLMVYNTPTLDGLVGGSPHMHFACSEAYLVINGQGSVQTLSSAGFREVPLRVGSLVWFTPGLIHRLVNHDGKLEIFAVMENAGLPEHGDSVLTFPMPYLVDELSYLPFASIEKVGSTFDDARKAAEKRRDLAVEGFLALRAGLENGSLQSFYRRAVPLMRSKVSAWREVWQSGPARTIQRTKDFLDQLQMGASDYLDRGRAFEAGPASEQRQLGMCGTLRKYLPEGELIAGQLAPETNGK